MRAVKDVCPFDAVWHRMEFPLDRAFYWQLIMAGELRQVVQDGVYDETPIILRAEVRDAVSNDGPQPSLWKFWRGCKVAN
jgi:hypothetical protein